MRPKAPVEAPAPKNKEDFASVAEKRLKEAQEFGEDGKMTLIELDESALTENMEAEQASKFVDNLQSYLQACSVGGDSVGLLDDHKYGIIHDRSVGSGDMESRISNMVKLFDPTATDVDVKAATVDLGNDALTEEDISKALVYTINRFVEEGGENFAVKSLSDSYKEALDETLTKVNAFRRTIGSDSFTLVFQPIVHLESWKVQHYEALLRMQQGERLFLPARFIGFAEQFGVGNKFDMIVVKKALALLRTNRNFDATASMAVNLSGRSLSTDAFLQQLLTALAANRDLLPRLMFEVTETSELRDLDATNKILQKLRGLGCKILIDDFGAGAAAFNYLKALEVDYVKIDGSYIRDAFDTRYGRPFLKSIAQLASEMKIKSIGEMVEDNQTMWLLRDVGVDYGQGYFFGRPMPDASDFQLGERPVQHVATAEE